MFFEGKMAAAMRQSVAQPSPALRPVRPDAGMWLLSVALALAAVLEQIRLGLDTDVSWLLTVGEQMLEGKRLYVDIFEVNPPASVWIYLPGIALAQAFGLTAELVTASLVFLLAAVSLWAAGRLLSNGRLLQQDQRAPVLCCAVFAFVLLPGLCFAQREHVAVLALLPFMAVLALRLRGRPIHPAAAVMAGLGCGIALSIKPHFALAVAPMPLLLMWRRQSILAALRAEVWAAAALVVTYAVLAASFYPIYFTEALPLLTAVYLPARNGFSEIWLSPAVLLFGAAVATLAFIGRSALLRSPSALPVMAAVGFAAAMAVQGKGYLNHAYPPVALALFGLALIQVEGLGERVQRTMGAVVLGLLASVSLFVFDLALSDHYPEVAQVVKRVAPPNPRILVAGSNLSVGHPLTRWVRGEWVGRRGSLWATGGAVQLRSGTTDPAQRALLQSYVNEDRTIFVEDIERGRPDVILVPRPTGTKWIATNPDVARAMEPYQSAGQVHDIDVMVRRRGPGR